MTTKDIQSTQKKGIQMKLLRTQNKYQTQKTEQNAKKKKNEKTTKNHMKTKKYSPPNKK